MDRRGADGPGITLRRSSRQGIVRPACGRAVSNEENRLRYRLSVHGHTPPQPKVIQLGRPGIQAGRKREENRHRLALPGRQFHRRGRRRPRTRKIPQRTGRQFQRAGIEFDLGRPVIFKAKSKLHRWRRPTLGGRLSHALNGCQHRQRDLLRRGARPVQHFDERRLRFVVRTRCGARTPTTAQRST